MDERVVIIGGGPTGIGAALTLARSGIIPLLITKSKYKEAGNYSQMESITPDVYDLFRQLNIENAIHAASRSSYPYFVSNGYVKTFDNGNGYHISRYELDRYLQDIIVARGIKVMKEVRIAGINSIGSGYEINLGNQQSIRCSFIIDATGSGRILGRLFKLQEISYSPKLTCWSGISKIQTKEIFKKLNTGLEVTNSGWAWFAPLDANECAWTRLSTTNECDHSPPELLQQYLQIGPIRSANVTWRLFKNVADIHYIIAGEAAGLLDPGTGHGIYKAINSGIYAAEVARELLLNHPMGIQLLEKYNSSFSQSFIYDAKLLSAYYRRLGFFF